MSAANTAEPDAETAIELKTLADLPFHALGRYPRALLVGQSRGGVVDGVSTRDWFDMIRDVALGLQSLGIAAGDRIAIVSESRPEWITTDLAAQTLGAVTVPIYPTLTGTQAGYMLRDSAARIAVVSTPGQIEKLQAIRHELPALEAIVAFEPGDGATASVIMFADLAARGHARMIAEWGVARAFRDQARLVRPDQLATIIYTSGTTGEPKGVMLTHHNLVSNLVGGHAIVPVGSDDVSLSYLPLSHSFERIVSYVYLAYGVTIIFAESMDTIGRDMQAVRPTVITGVPRVYEKFMARILEKGSGLPQPQRRLFQWGVSVARARARTAADGRRPGGLLGLKVRLAERLVFGKIRDGVGGRLRILASGSAPLPREVAEFFYGVGLPITEGYGLTETSPILTANPPGAAKIGSVGRAIPGVEIRIDADGEILARGPNVMQGYLNKPEESAAVLRDGWFHTGDIGVLDGDGYLAITDRKKDLLVTSGGKKVAPQPIEAVLRRSPLVAEAVVLGDGHRFIAALIVPEFTALEKRLKDLGRPPGDREHMVTREDVIALYAEIVDALNRDLSQFERLKKFALLPRELSAAEGELTPTMKVKRRVVEHNWSAAIAALYR